MNALYSPLNIYIALVGVVVWTEYDEITLSTDGDTTLKNFLNYRKERLVKEHPNDNAQLLTGIQFEGGVVGKALKGPMCTYEFSGERNVQISVSVANFEYSKDLNNRGVLNKHVGCSVFRNQIIMWA